MLGLRIILDGDGAWPDMEGCPEATLVAVARLPRGMASGKASVGLRLKMPDGTLVFAQTSMELFQAAALAFRSAEQRGNNG